MKLKYLLVCLTILIIILLSGCVKTPDQLSSEVEELRAANVQLKEEISELESQITNLKNTLNEVTEERDDYLEQLDEFFLTEIKSEVDLIYWTDDEIVRALGNYNKKFNSAVWQTYNYRREEKDFYWAFNTSLGFVPDPFFHLRLKDSDTELDFFHFRIERFALNNNRTLAQEKYEAYRDKVLVEAEADQDLRCYEQTTCRDIKVVKCTKNNQNYHSWFEGSRLFTTRFDDREALDAFEKFYCHPERI